MTGVLLIGFHCYQSVKDRKFESNSQPIVQTIALAINCYQSVKDRKFESNLQHGGNSPE